MKYKLRELVMRVYFRIQLKMATGSVSELAKFYLTFSDLVAMVVVSKYFENLQDIVNSHFRVFFVD